MLEAALLSAMVVPEFLQYSEDPSARIDTLKIQRHKPLWQCVYRAHPALTFMQTDMESTFKRIVPQASQKWSRILAEDEVSKWATSQAKQFRCMARHIKQAIIKAKCPNQWPPWLKRTLEPDSTPQEEPTPCMALGSETDSSTQLVRHEATMALGSETDSSTRGEFHWDHEQCQGYKLGSGSLPVWAIKNDHCGEHVVATFADGTRHEYGNVTATKLTDRRRPHARHWHCTHQGKQLFTTIIAGRSPLAVFYVQMPSSKPVQMCQTAVRSWLEGDENVEDEAL